MGVEINAECDECGSNAEGDYIYCDTCYGDLKTKLEELEAENEELKEQLEECKEGCSECNNKVKCLVTKEKR